MNGSATTLINILLQEPESLEVYPNFIRMYKQKPDLMTKLVQRIINSSKDSNELAGKLAKSEDILGEDDILKEFNEL